MRKASEYVPGFTFRSCLASLFGIVIITLVVQFFECIGGSDMLYGGYAVPLPAMFVILPLLLVSGGIYALTRNRLLTQAEMVVCLFALFLATPLVSAGFWTMMIGAIGTVPKTADFETYDAWPEKLWPHGKNLIEAALTESRRDRLEAQGRVWWKEVEYEAGRRAVLPILENASDSDTAWIRITAPMASREGDGDGIIVGEPYLLTVLLRPENLSPAAYYYCRVFYDDTALFATEAFSARARGEVNYLHQKGFLRRGMYGLTVSREARSNVHFELGLVGKGELALAEAELLSVGTLDVIYHGRKVIARDRYEALGESPRAELLVRPNRMASLEGLRFILSGYIPWRDWVTPFFVWTSFAFLCLLGTLALAALMRRQWIESERYPLPLTRIPAHLLGEGEETIGALPAIWRNRTMWLGFALTMFWCLMKGLHVFNSNVPDMNIEVQLTPYFTDPMWGKMWYGQEVRNVTFTVTALFLSVAIFMELNVLMSLVLGFFLFRSQYWFGEATGLALKKDFPFLEQQQVGAYIAYALLIVFFTRKYLWNALKEIVPGSKKPQAGDVFSSRTIFALLGLCLAGVALWAVWTDIPMRGMLVYFVFLMMIGLVAAKIRAECGVLMGSFTPVNVGQLMPLAGGMPFFGPEGVMFLVFTNWIIFRSVFFLLPGMQVELVEMGRRFCLPPRHIVYTALLGAIGGLVLGGWVFLSLGYALGGDNFGQRWPYMDKAGLTIDFHTEMAKANAVLPDDAAAGEGGRKFETAMIGFLFGAAVTALLGVLRQAFTGFWFHPVGFIVGSTVLMECAWGSVLAAFIIRAITLKIGGAITVRRKLMPFFVGVFVAAVTAHMLFGAINGYLYFFHPSVIREAFTF